MKTIELIHKLSELGRLVEAYKEKTSAQAVWIVPAGGSKESYWELFRAEVRKVAKELISEKAANRIRVKCLDLQKSATFKQSFDELFDELLYQFSKRELRKQDEFIIGVVLTAICHKMGVELESEKE